MINGNLRRRMAEVIRKRNVPEGTNTKNELDLNILKKYWG